MPTLLSPPIPETARRSTAAKYRTDALACAMVRNSWLTAGLFVVGGAFAWNTYVTHQTMQAVRDLKDNPVVVRVSEVGRADVVQTRTNDYRPQDADLINALGTFVEKHYRRVRSILLDQELGYGASLLSVEGTLARGIEEQDTREHWLDDFMAGKTSEFVATSDENDVTVDNVVIRTLEPRNGRMPAGTATVTYHKTFFSPDHTITGRKDFEETIAFTFAKKITPAMYMTNPLGLVITYFKSFEALKK